MEISIVPHLLSEFAAEQFSPLAGQTLRFLRPEATAGAGREHVDLTVLNVRPSPYPGLRGKRQPFSLLLTLRDAAPLNDRHLHTLVHPDFEQCELLLSRVLVPELERHDGTMYYELIFS